MVVSIDRLYYRNRNKRTLGGGAKQTAGEKRLAAKLGPMDTAIANKFIKTLSVAEVPSRGHVQVPGQDTKDNTPPTDTFKVGTELMYGGQGKLTSTTNLTLITDNSRAFEGDITDQKTISIRPAVEGLAPPSLEDMNEEVTGDDRK